MAALAEDQEFRRKMDRLDNLVRKVDLFTDPSARAHTIDLVQSLLELHGIGLERALEQIADSRETGVELIRAIATDGLVGSLLLLHGLHPLDLETRVRQALDLLRPVLSAHQCNVELLAIAHGVVQLRFEKSGHGCASTAANLKRDIEDAIREKAPDVEAIELLDATPAAANQSTFIPVEELRVSHRSGGTRPQTLVAAGAAP